MSRVKWALRRVGIDRRRVAGVRMCCERNVLAWIGAEERAQRARILCYHSVGTPEWGVNDVSPDQFRRHIEFALHIGYRFVAAEDIARTVGRPDELAITFDDGLASVATNAAPVLREYGIPWTMFVVSDWASGRHAFGDGVLLDWRGIERIAAAGASIGSHSVSHPNLHLLSATRAADELFESRRAIEAHTGIVPRTFAIPFGQSRNWSPTAQRLAREAGYDVVFAQSEARRPAGTVARTFITRFDNERIFPAALRGTFDRWEEWM
jgi:peptidoglycan/xylan/chitin deacetylase (PgdA/CDA1 family)